MRTGSEHKNAGRFALGKWLKEKGKKDIIYLEVCIFVEMYVYLKSERRKIVYFCSRSPRGNVD